MPLPDTRVVHSPAKDQIQVARGTEQTRGVGKAEIRRRSAAAFAKLIFREDWGIAASAEHGCHLSAVRGATVTSRRDSGVKLMRGPFTASLIKMRDAAAPAPAPAAAPFAPAATPPISAPRAAIPAAAPNRLVLRMTRPSSSAFNWPLEFVMESTEDLIGSGCAPRCHVSNRKVSTEELLMLPPFFDSVITPSRMSPLYGPGSNT